MRARLQLLYYVYAIIGMEIWAGLMRPDNPALIDSDYAEEDYFRNNFDSFDSALVVLFEVMTVLSWNDIRAIHTFAGDTQGTVARLPLTIRRARKSFVWIWSPPQLIDGFVRVTNVWSRVYFIAFHISSSIVFLKYVPGSPSSFGCMDDLT